MVIGVNFRTAAASVREHFFMTQTRRLQSLTSLSQAEGIEEVMILSTCERTEFLVWADDAALAANSVLRLLSSQCELQLCDWKHFYRMVDEAALLHTVRVASGLDSRIVGETNTCSQLKAAWEEAQKAGMTGRYLDRIVRQALAIAGNIQREIAAPCISLPAAAVELSHQLFGSMASRTVLIFGAGAMGEISARYVAKAGTGAIRIVSHRFENAVELAGEVGGTAVPFERRWREMEDADMVIFATSSPTAVMNRSEAEWVVARRNGRPLCLVDMGMPRNVDSSIRGLAGMFLYSLDDIESAMTALAERLENQSRAAAAEKIAVAEVRQLRRMLFAEPVIPTMVAVRERLEVSCREELDHLRREYGPFPKEQEEMLGMLVSRVAHRIAGYLAREVKDLPDKAEQAHIREAVQRLFHVKDSESELAGTRL